MPARGFASHFPRGSGNHLFAPWRQKRSPDYGAVVLIIHWLTSGVAALGEGNQNLPKEVLAHVALCGLEHRQQTRFLIGSPEKYVDGHTLSIMLTQIKYCAGVRTYLFNGLLSLMATTAAIHPPGRYSEPSKVPGSALRVARASQCTNAACPLAKGLPVALPQRTKARCTRIDIRALAIPSDCSCSCTRKCASRHAHIAASRRASRSLCHSVGFWTGRRGAAGPKPGLF